MARQCAVCGKQAAVGNRVEIRGKAKYLGGVGTKVTGITRRKFKPNMQTKRIFVPELDRYVRVRVSTSELRTIDKIGFVAFVKRQGLTLKQVVRD